MSVETITKIKCDVCKNEMKQAFRKQQKIQVVFETDQTEGRATKPYLSMEEIDLCVTCLSIIMNGKMLFGSGAQGHNQYYFRDNK